ncbi:MAG TPA: substrate-binding domain-containing protein [Verrucomicrobiota bacterium]|nr:substrate-binding domain-containing protein [Verrucomicrobiota bacterium]
MTEKERARLEWARGGRLPCWLALGLGIVFGVLMARGVLAAVGGSTPPVKRYTVAVIPKGATHSFWKSIHAGARKAALELGNVDIVWKSGLKEDDRDSQIKVVEDMVIRKVSGIVLAPLDDVALRPPVNDAVRRGIPVVIIDSDLKSDKYTSFVATDNYQGGVKAGEHLGRLLGGRGRVVMLRCMEGSASTMQRERGFLDAMARQAGIQVLSSNRFGGATAEEAYKVSENLLAPHRRPDGSLALDGIFSSNESTTFGMLRALQDSQWAGTVKFVGFDSSPVLVRALENGELQGLVLQDPMAMGYLGVKTLVAHLRGEPVVRRIDTGSALATPENRDDPAIRKLLEPDLRQWLQE